MQRTEANSFITGLPSEEEKAETDGPPSSLYSTVYPEIVQFPVLDGGSQRRITEVQLLSWAMGRLGAAGTPLGTEIRSRATSAELGLLHWG